MSRPRLLDTFCGAGGAGMGYHRAGFDVVGVDIKPQPRYPFEFVQGDALEFIAQHGHEFDVIHASPPCQAYTRSASSSRSSGVVYADLMEATRTALCEIGRPYVIENVPEAKFGSFVKLCGSSFGLDVRRHRNFETSLFIWGMPCDHSWQRPRFRSLRHDYDELACVVGVHGNIQYKGEFELRCKAMGIDWMTNAELTQAIPPSYTQYIGEQIMLHLEEAA